MYILIKTSSLRRIKIYSMVMRQLFQRSEIINTFRKCAQLLSTRDRYFLVIFFILNLSLVSIEVFAVVLVGATVTAATAVIQSKEIPGVFNQIFESLTFFDLTPQMTVGLLGATVAMLLIAKSALSFYLSRRNFAFLARREPIVSEAFSRRVFSRSLDDINSYDVSEYQYALTLGASSVLGGILGGTILLTGELVLQIALSVTLFIYSPLLMLMCLLILSIIFIVLYRSQGTKASQIGSASANNGVEIFNVISNLVNSYRNLYVMNKRIDMVSRLRTLKDIGARFAVQSQLLGFVAKYVFDIAIVLLAVVIGLFSFVTRDAAGGLATIAIFVAAISRLAPSVLRVQQGLVNIRGAIGSTKRFFDIFEFSSGSSNLVELPILKEFQEGTGHLATPDPSIAVRLEKVSFTYRSRKKPSLLDISFAIPKGETWAIVGRSGAGKSTLVDLILGLNQPDSGYVKLFDNDPEYAISNELICVGYVPQNVYVSNESIVRNICFDEEETVNTNNLRRCIKLVGLESWIAGLPDGFYSRLGEGGSKLSGGQRQRLGIARALYRKPDLLILDEATSSLDAESEKAISDALSKLRGKMTMLIIAHRLSTIRNVDNIVYLKNGKLVAIDSFDRLRKKIPAFHRQAQIMGL